MPAEIILQQIVGDAALLEWRAQLAAMRSRLAEREADLAQVRAQLKMFERRYFRQVGVLYAQLDEMEARIAEREVDLYDSNAARLRAQEARQRAQETQEAAFGEAREAEEVEPPVSLKTLFRDVAKRIHPDFARDEAERAHFTRLMGRANLAYRRGDAAMLERLLDDHRETYATDVGEGAGAEHLLLARQMRHAERDLAALEAERQALLAGEIAQLYLDAEAAAREHRDLLSELAAGLREQIADAERRYAFLDRQMHAHGR